MAATTPLTADLQQVVNYVRALVEDRLERQRAAGRTPAEVAEERAALVAGIVEALGVESRRANRSRSSQP
jgi:hypothetical protein